MEKEHEHEPARTPPDVSSPQPSSPTSPAPAAPAPTSPPQQVPPHTYEPKGPGWIFYAKLAALLFFLGYSIAFIVGNDKTISVDFVFASGSVSLIWTILLLLLVGLLAGALLGHLYRNRRGKQSRQP
jgi:uncharacterized integral membrane protein